MCSRISTPASIRLLALLVLAGVESHAQTPSGTLAGILFDSSGARIPEGTVSAAHRDLSVRRVVTTTGEGAYSVSALPPGTYDVRVEAPGFQPELRQVVIQTGSTTLVDFTLSPGIRKDSITVEAPTPVLQAESYRVEGVVTREQVRDLPLNGRNFLELAKLEPGALVSVSPGAQGNRQFSVSVLGASPLRTRITVDGGSVGNFVAGDVAQNFSQEVIQEFQISTANFDAPAAFSGSGVVNIVTRSGGNDLHGSGFFYFRDHNVSAHPGLRPEEGHQNPYFARRHAGLAVGGPVLPNRLFFFSNFEHINQDGVVNVQPLSPEFAHFGTTALSPLDTQQVSGRIDAHLQAGQTIFLRYSHDGNNAFAPGSAPGLTLPGATIEGVDQLLRPGSAALPSNWRREKNWADQALAGVTSSIGSHIVNDLRFAYFYLSNRASPAAAADCAGPCLGLGSPAISILGANFTFGESIFGPGSATLRNYQTVENLTYQKGVHRLRFGLEWEHQQSYAVVELFRSGSLLLYSPEIARRAMIPSLPAEFRSIDDILQLPLVNFQLGVGDPRLPPAYNYDRARVNNRWFFYAQDTWRLHPRFTLDYALRYTLDTNALNHDLSKPGFLSPFTGAEGLEAPGRDKNNFGPSLGFAWMATEDQRTVIRAGSGIYYDSFLTIDKLTERSILGPRGVGRFPVDSGFIPNTSFGIPGVPFGAPLSFTEGPTGYTGAHALAIFPFVRQQLSGLLGTPSDDLSVRNIDLLKQGSGLIPKGFAMPYSIHLSAGVQRELGRNLAVSATLVMRRFVHNTILNVDHNRWDSIAGPVLRRCSTFEVLSIGVPCSTGPVAFHVSAGRSVYRGLLLKVSKRLSGRVQFLASYALSSNTGLNGVINKDDWFESYGPLASDRRHLFTAAGVLQLPWSFQLSFVSTIASKTPFSAYVAGLDFNGDGTISDLLPGLRANRLNRGVDKDELRQLVDAFNQNWAGRRTPRGQLIPTLQLPEQFELGDSLVSQDARLSRSILFGEKYRLTPFVEVFNLFNVANLSGYGSNLAEGSSFGRPSNRVVQVFGSGGPRALQFALRLDF